MRNITCTKAGHNWGVFNNQKDNYKHTFNEKHQCYWANNRQIIFPGIDNYENLKKAYKRFLEVGIN